MDVRTRSSSLRAWIALVLGIAGVATVPAAIEVARRSRAVALLDAFYAVPLAFVLGALAVGMARRARENLRWLRLRDDGTGIATAAVIAGALAVCLALVAALSVGFYELVLIYQRRR